MCSNNIVGCRCTTKQRIYLYLSTTSARHINHWEYTLLLYVSHRVVFLSFFFFKSNTTNPSEEDEKMIYRAEVQAARASKRFVTRNFGQQRRAWRFTLICWSPIFLLMKINPFGIQPKISSSSELLLAPKNASSPWRIAEFNLWQRIYCFFWGRRTPFFRFGSSPMWAVKLFCLGTESGT